MTGPKEVTLRFGDKDFRLRVQQLADPSGQRLGMMAEWVDITEERTATQEITDLVESIRQGVLTRRIDLEGKSGLLQLLGGQINAALDAVISPLRVAANYVERISRGDIPQPITDDYSGDFNDIKNNLNALISNLNVFVASQIEMKERHDAGDIDHIINVQQFQGVYGHMANMVNELVQSHIKVKMHVVDVVSQFALGNFDIDIDRLPGKKAQITAAIDKVKASLQSIAVEVMKLSEAAARGELSYRADTSQFSFMFKKMIEGVNQTIDSIVGPLNVAANYVDRISKGDIPEKITDNYNGDFNTIKNNLNRAIDAVNKMIADANMLSKAAVDGLLSTRADASQHEGDFRKIVQGVNETLDAVINPL
ncbi:MAG: HAMP domain-containing protein, partial [Limnobacter sp.]|uniref:HAMP domain-containing protein n=1 Tax=Limnobacter sp. TaxID=2003368 RepID=UPI0039191649